MSLRTNCEIELYSKESIELPRLIKNWFPKIQSIHQPDSIEELQELISSSKKNRISIIPRGAATSGMGSITPLKKSIMIDLTHLNRILDIDQKKKTILFESGLRWWQLKRILKKHSLDLYTFPTSLFSTVGGWLATGGYGINSFRYGHVSNRVDSIEIVTPNKNRKINRSDREFEYFIGTEGQMGIISKVKLRIHESEPTKPHLVFFNTSSEAVSFLCDLPKSLKVQSVHVSYLDKNRLEHKNSLLSGKACFPLKEGVLFSFDQCASHDAFLSYAQRKRGILAEDYLTSFLWNERFFPFSIRRFYPSVLGCETILPIENLHHYINHTRMFGENYGTQLSTEATLINNKEAVVFTIFPSDPHNLSHFFHLLLSYSLANIASKWGGKPYGIGTWNLPLLTKILSKKEINEYKRFKKESDPLNTFNPAKAFSGDLKIKPVLKLAYLMSTLFSSNIPLIKSLSKILNHHELKPRDLPEPEACANCGACTEVCPSYLINKTEAVTAKGKLFLKKNLLNGSSLPTHIREMMFLCLHCHLCEYVCQSKLKLNPVWDQIESVLEKKYGRPKEKIDEFIQQAESHPAYLELLDSFNIPPNNNLKDSPNV